MSDAPEIGDRAYQRNDSLNPNQILEICASLKVKTSMLALGACERVKKIARSNPVDILRTPIVNELVCILQDGAHTPLGGAAMSALAVIALIPEGRQIICLLGGAHPLIKLVAKAEVEKPNTLKAVTLLTNLVADQQNRKIVRDADGVEALVACMKVAPLDVMMESLLAVIHNILLADVKAKQRAVNAGVAIPVSRILGSKVSESSLISIRTRMLITDLLNVEGIQHLVEDAARTNGFKLPRGNQSFTRVDEDAKAAKEEAAEVEVVDNDDDDVEAANP